jgi:uncharacterized Fe-S cluster protein YjdI
MARKEYRSERAVVSFDPKRCIHARYCVAYPRCSTWIRPDKAQPGRVAEVVICCSTGALQFERRDISGGDRQGVT